MVDPVMGSEGSPYLTPITPPSASDQASKLQGLERAHLQLPSHSGIGTNVATPEKRQKIQASLVEMVKKGQNLPIFSHFPTIAASVLLSLFKKGES